MQQCREKNVGGVDGILNCIKRCVKIVRGGNMSCHLLGWFDAGNGGWVCLGIRQTSEHRGGHGECLRMQKR